MSKLPQTPNIGQLGIADSDPEDLFASPEQARGKKKNKGKQNANDAVPAASVSRTVESQYDAEKARESALRNELGSVRSINKAIEGVVESLEKAKDNMERNSRDAKRRLEKQRKTSGEELQQHRPADRLAAEGEGELRQLAEAVSQAVAIVALADTLVLADKTVEDEVHQEEQEAELVEVLVEQGEEREGLDRPRT
ncbi:hypothetical protein LTR28_010588 [Elasticomyces elasticus]|nr:hypothetical protein LTR28_010588 [Elasticomyces elasticus]